MFIARVKSKGKKGKSYVSILLRQSIRIGSKITSKTCAVMTDWPSHIVHAIEKAIKGADGPAESLSALAKESRGALDLRNGPSFGALFVVHQIALLLGIPKALGVTQDAHLGLWQVLARTLRPATSLLAMVRLAGTCAAASLLQWKHSFTEDDLYKNGEWLCQRQDVIEKRLWEQKAAQPGPLLFLYDVTSSYFEGQCNELAQYGYNRDGKKHKKQVVVGLLADQSGDPCAIKVYEGNQRDHKTFEDQIHTIKKGLGCKEVVMVGDRGMIRSAQKEQAQKAGMKYITALTKPQIEKLLRKNVFQMELFDSPLEEVIAEGKRYVLRRNPLRQQEMEQSRQGRLQRLKSAVEQSNTYLKEHRKAKVATQQSKLGGMLKSLKLDGWTSLEIKERTMTLNTDDHALQEESKLDGCYVIETDLAAGQCTKEQAHDRYKDLALVERDFRTMKQGHLEMRPWFVCKEVNTRAHALTCMLSLKIRRHLEKAWAKYDCTVEEGLLALEKLCVVQLVDTQSGKVLEHIIPDPDELQGNLLEALKLKLPKQIPISKLVVGTRVKLPNQRKTIDK